MTRPSERLPPCPAPAPDDTRLRALGHLLHAFGVDQASVQTLDRPPQDGPPPRPVLHGKVLLLPDTLTTHPDPDLALAASAHALGHLLHSPRRQATGRLKPIGLAIAAAVEDCRCDRLLMRSHPGLERLFRTLLARHPAADGVGFEHLVERLQRALIDPELADDHPWVTKARELFEAALDELEQPAVFRRIAAVLANDLGQLRVRMNLQAYAPPLPWHDDNSHLWQHPEDAHQAETHVRQEGVPAGTAAHRPAGEGEAAAATPAHSLHAHAEWHYRLGRYRSDWCTVAEIAPAPARTTSADADDGSRRDAPLRIHTAPRLRPALRQRRQWDGEELDLDAATAAALDLRLGRAPDPRLFRRNRPGDPALDLLVLLDLSASTADRLDDGRSILDVECEAARALVAALHRQRGRIAVAGFDSDGRHAVRYHRLVDFDTAHAHNPPSLLQGLRPGQSTRLGAAIRHATSILRSRPMPALIVVSDGSPADIDVFDPQHLVEDARVAVSEARRSGVRCAGLMLGEDGREAARRIFGINGHRILTRTAMLGRALRACHRDLSIN